MSTAQIAATPSLLWCSVESNLQPTIAFLTRKLGMSTAKIAAMPILLCCSVESNLKPTVAFLTEELGMRKAKIATTPCRWQAWRSRRCR